MMDPTRRIEELTKKLSHLTGRDYSRVVTLWLLGGAKEREELASMLEVEHRRLTKDKDALWLEPMPEEKIRGDLNLGKVLCQDSELYPFRIETEAFLRHATIFGHSGSGKTNLGYIILQHLLQRGMPFLVFDWKRNYRDLLALVGKQSVAVFTVGRSIRPFHINPLIPPSGTSPEVWLKKITEIIARAYYVGEGVMSILHRGIDAVYRDFGVYEGKVERWPTMEDVRRWVEDYVSRASMKELKAQWIASTHRTLQSLCYGEMGRVLNVDQPTKLEELLYKPVILELDALSETDKTLIVDTLLLWIHHYRLQEKDREKLKHIILIEEAHHVLRREELTARESILDVVLREIRELGEGIIMIDQSPAQFSQNAVGNSATSFVFALKDHADVMTAANFLLLDLDQRAYLNQLPVGTCVVKSQDAYRKPFLVKLPHVRVPKGAVSDEDLVHQAEEATGAGGLTGLPDQLVEPARSLLQAVEELRAARRDLRESQPDSSSSRPSQLEQPERTNLGAKRVCSRIDKVLKKLDEAGVQFLRDVLEYPYSGISSRYERLKVSAKNGNRTKASLEGDGVISITAVNKGDAQVKLVELTPLGRELVRQVLPDWRITAHLHRNGAEHRYWKDRVASTLEAAGLHVEKEKPLNGDRVDVHAGNGNGTAIEIETGKSDIRKNIEKNLKAGYKDILIVPTNRKARRKVERVLQRHRPSVGHDT